MKGDKEYCVSESKGLLNYWQETSLYESLNTRFIAHGLSGDLD